MGRPAMTLDDLRAARPGLGFALYAMEPGGGVTLEVHDGERLFTFKGSTEEAAIAVAFPPPAPALRSPLAPPEEDVFS